MKSHGDANQRQDQAKARNHKTESHQSDARANPGQKRSLFSYVWSPASWIGIRRAGAPDSL
jgi:hypothetical protein